MSRPTKIKPEDKKRQGFFLEGKFKSFQGKMGGQSAYTQTDLGEDVGAATDPTGEMTYSQTNVSQWFKGQTAVPDHVWLALSSILEFDPFELRPDLMGLKAQLDSAFVKWRPLADRGSPQDHKRLLECFMKADRRGRESILRLAEIEASQGKE